MGNGARFVVAALWTYVLNLHIDLCLNLDDCCYVPTLIKNSSFLFEQKGFLFIFFNNGCYIMMSFMLVVH